MLIVLLGVLKNFIIWRNFFGGGGFNTDSSFPSPPRDKLFNFFREEPFFFFILGLKTGFGTFWGRLTAI